MDDEKICTCTGNRALRPEESVQYLVPQPKLGRIVSFVTARDCPLHGVKISDEPDKTPEKNVSGGS